MGYVKGVHAVFVSKPGPLIPQTQLVSLSVSVLALLQQGPDILIVMGSDDMEFHSKHVHINVLLILHDLFCLWLDCYFPGQTSNLQDVCRVNIVITISPWYICMFAEACICFYSGSVSSRAAALFQQPAQCLIWIQGFGLHCCPWWWRPLCRRTL